MSNSQDKAFNHSRLTHIWTALIIVFVLGGIVGISAALLSLLLEVVQTLMLGGAESMAAPVAATQQPWRWTLSIIAASIVAALVWFFLRAHIKVPSVSGAVHGKKMPVVATIIHVIMQIFIVGAGLSIGRETAPRELGSLLGQKASAALKLRAEDMTIVVAIAAGAGFAGVYDAPLAGMFFAVEMLLVDVSIRTVILSFGTSAVAAFSARLIKGHHTFYSIHAIEVSHSLILMCVIIGPIMGAIAYYYRRGTDWAARNQVKGTAILWQLPLMGVVTGIVAYFLPNIMGNGRALAQYAYDAAGIQVVGILLLTAALKAIVTMLTVRSGASGGVLTPAIAVGGALGAVIAIGAQYILPDISISVVALIASAAFLATSQRAPLMASCLLIELSSSSIHAFIPLGVAVFLSVAVSSSLERLNAQHKGISHNIEPQKS
ncbi:chloride channel protein [Alloscardovia criceti]|uniref:chloride channel protein n=1 Tax=Alloscardovia criceti TaxID=356828 RepID=UPI0003735B77|nr:chloride channel protein [Alloscardovia criceti]